MEDHISPKYIVIEEVITRRLVVLYLCNSSTEKVLIQCSLILRTERSCERDNESIERVKLLRLTTQYLRVYRSRTLTVDQLSVVL